MERDFLTSDHWAGRPGLVGIDMAEKCGGGDDDYRDAPGVQPARGDAFAAMAGRGQGCRVIIVQ